MKFVFFLFILIAGFSKAEASDCLPAGRVQPLLDRFGFEIWKGAGWEKPGTEDFCDSQALAYKTMQSLLFLQDLPKFPVREDAFDFNIIGTSAFDFFAQRTQKVSIEDTATSANCKRGAIAFARTKENAMFVCPAGINQSLLFLSSAFVHEARHVDGFPHDLCNAGYFTGSFACDENYTEGGAYGVSVEFKIKIYRSPDIHPLVRTEARFSAIADLMLHFNEAVFGITEGALLLAENGVLYFYDWNSITPLLSNIPQDTIVGLRNTPTLLNRSNGSAINYLTQEISSDTPGLYAQMFRQFSEEERRKIVDAHFGRYSCFLYAESFRCDSSKGAKTIPLPTRLKPVQFLSLGGVNTSEQVFIVSETGELYSLPQNKDIETWTEADVKLDTGFHHILGLSLFYASKKVAITSDGMLSEWTRIDGVGTWSPIPAYKSVKFQKLLAPYRWSPKLLDF